MLAYFFLSSTHKHTHAHTVIRSMYLDNNSKLIDMYDRKDDEKYKMHNLGSYIQGSLNAESGLINYLCLNMIETRLEFKYFFFFINTL